MGKHGALPVVRFRLELRRQSFPQTLVARAFSLIVQTSQSLVFYHEGDTMAVSWPAHACAGFCFVANFGEDFAFL